jgi:phage baseplate assembly protein W
MSKVEMAITLPFSIDSTGNVSRTFDQSKIWADRVRSVIGTLKSERVMNGTFGTSIPDTVFGNFDTIKDAITREVTDSFAAFLPQLTLEEVSVVSNEAENTVYADIRYALPNNKVSSVMVGIATITGNNIINEVYL